MEFEESLIKNAAPTLAGIKVASMYNYRFSDPEECRDSISRLNQQLNHKGIYIELLQCRSNFYLLYVYRRSQLHLLLRNDEIREFLRGYGYNVSAEITVRSSIEVLKKRVREASCFPHEIGVFLGYPLEDVREFIAREGEGCKLCGEWKVYHDVQSARCFFCKLKKCRDVYFRIYRNGRSLSDMTVTA